MNNKFFVISDVHLERKNVLEQQFILNTINETIVKHKKTGVEPVIVCAGDIHNGSKGLEWLSKINAQVVYICGNHEYWNNDYNQAILEISKNTPENVHFLHNDFVILNDMLFLGGTLWSDLGETFNPDLFSQAQYTMNDVNYIRHEQWYENPDNIEKLKALSPLHAQNLIEKKAWNCLIEREENTKALKFFENFMIVYEHLSKLEEIEEKLESNLYSKYDYYKISKEQYTEKLENLHSYKYIESFTEWMNNNLKELSIDYHINEKFYQGNDEQDRIFNKLKNLDFKNKKLIVVSHHLPFIEEKLIGRQEWFDDKINNDYMNNLPPSIYSLRKGLDYPYHNYFWRISKGEFSHDENITHVIHYCNDGSANLPYSLIKMAECWVHGHEHSYNYEDVLKGIKIATNPLAHSMAVFRFKEGESPKLNDMYKNYHKITPEKEAQEIKELQESFLREINLDLPKQELKKAVTIWALKHFKWDEYLELNRYVEKLNQKLLKTLLKNPQWSFKMTETEYLNVGILMDAIDMGISRLDAMENKLNEAVTIRTNDTFSFAQKYGHAMESAGMESFLRNTDLQLNKFNRKALVSDYKGHWDFEMWIQYSFNNTQYIEINKKELLKNQMIVEKFNIERVKDIDANWLKVYDKAFTNRRSQKVLYKFDLDRKLPSKLNALKKQYKLEDKVNKPPALDTNF